MQIQQLAQRIRRLEAESFPSGMPEEARSLIDELDLVPVDSHDREILDGNTILDTVEALGYTCRKGEDFVMVETGGFKIEVFYDRLPVITIINWFILDENDEELDSLWQAAKAINHNWDMVKVDVLSDYKRLMVYLDARHQDTNSFRKNIRYYIEQIVGATEDLRKRYEDNERSRVSKGCLRSSNQIAS